MKEKRKTPYQMLMEEAQRVLDRMLFPRRVMMWRYTQGDLESGQYSVGTFLRERVLAAQQLGYEVHLEAEAGGGLSVMYVERRMARSDLPFLLR